MKSFLQFTKRLPRLVWLASSVAMLSSPLLVCFHHVPQQVSESAGANNFIVRDQSSIARDMAVQKYENLPLNFEANCGQADSAAKFVARGPGYTLSLASNQAVMTFCSATSPSVDSRLSTRNSESATVRMRLVGGDDDAGITALDALPGKTNYFIGSDPINWRTDVANYARVKCQDVYPGIDLVYYGNQRQLEYDFEVAAGADPEAIRLTFAGAKEVQIDDVEGHLTIATSAGDLLQHKPVVYQHVNGTRQEIDCSYVIRSNREVGFEIAEYDHGKPLIIDPVLSYSTYIGGRGGDSAAAIAVDAAGNAYLTGSTSSADFPNTTGGFQPGLVKVDAFVTKINSSGTAIIYSTYLGGSDTENLGRGERGYAIAVDQSGNAYVTGETSSSDFPTTSGALRSTALFDSFLGGNIDAFVTKLNATGSALVYSTYLGGLHPGFEAPVASTDIGFAIAVDSEGSAYVAGQTNSGDFPVANAFQPARIATDDAFVSKLNPAGTALVYSTYLGGSSKATGIAVDKSGNAYVTGTTASASFPVTPDAIKTSLSGSVWPDAFVTKLDRAGTSLLYSTYLGGRDAEEAAGIAIDPAGNAYVTGYTRSTDFPTMNPVQPSNASGPVFKTTNGGASWFPLSVGLTAPNLFVISVDPKFPSNVYAVGGVAGIFKSTNGGTTWSAANTGLPTDVQSLAIDPVTTSTLYAGLGSNGVYKSTNGGASWSATGLTRTSSPVQISALAIDPTNTAIVYAGGMGFAAVQFEPTESSQALPPLTPTVLYKSTDGGSTWRISDGGLPPSPNLRSIAIDPKSTATLYVGSSAGVFTSDNAGNTWIKVDLSATNINAIAIDPQETSTIYAVSSPGLFKSTNAGRRWRDLGEPLSDAAIHSVVIDPTNTATLYVSVFPGILKSTNGGERWSETGLQGGINGLAIDPINTSTLYATTSTTFDVFVAKLNASGTALVYSTYLGGRNDDLGRSIAVDADGNATVTGTTSSEDFPIKDAIQPIIGGGPNKIDAFITRLTPAGALSYSTFFGGKGIESGDAVALDAHGNAYVTGSTSSGNFPTSSPIQSELRGQGDAFLIKLSLPRIIGVAISGKKLIVSGEGFAQGAVILLDGNEQKTRNDETNPSTILIATKAGKSIAPGQRVSIKVRNPDGTLSNEFFFLRSSE